MRMERLFREYAPELMNRFFDVVTVQKSLSKMLIDFSSASIQVVFGLVLLSVYHPLFIVFSLCLVALVGLILRLTVNKGLETSLKESKSKYELAHWLQELARTNHVFKLAGTSELPLERVNERTGEYVRYREAHFRTLMTQYRMMIAFKVLVALGLLLIGSILVMEQQMNIGQFVASEIIILLVINSVEKLILNFETAYDLLTSLEKIGQVTDLELDPEHGVINGNGGADFSVALHGVSFQYPGEVEWALDQVDLRIEQGERVLLTGPRESGKSALLHIISGLFQPNQGAVTVNGVPLRNYHSGHIRSRIGVYMRDEKLFEGTLLENITLGRRGVDFDAVRKIVRELGLEEMIGRLPEGYDTRILPHGRQFSESTLIRILLARTLVGRPKIILLESSFSILPPDERERVFRFLLDPEHGWTVVMAGTGEFCSELFNREIYLQKGAVKDIKK